MSPAYQMLGAALRARLPIFLFSSHLRGFTAEYGLSHISSRDLVGPLENLLANAGDFFFSQRISLFSENKSRLFNFNRRDCNNWEKLPEAYFLCQRPSPWGIAPLLVSTFLPLTISAILPLTRSSGKMVPSLLPRSLRYFGICGKIFSRIFLLSEAEGCALSVRRRQEVDPPFT